VKVPAFGKDSYDIAPAGSVDAVLSFRNVHNWYMADFAPDAFKAFFKALKPGGTLGIVEHRLPEEKPDSLMKSSGYMKVSYVRSLAEAAGFKFVGASNINANPKDTKDYPKGVWTLPPNFAEGDTDKAKYAAIGESDRMTLRFVKAK
jgi:predicted methyltransferase